MFVGPFVYLCSIAPIGPIIEIFVTGLEPIQRKQMVVETELRTGDG